MNRTKVLITGGAGFIGTKLAERLKESNEVTVLDSFHPQIHKGNVNTLDGVRYVVGSVADKSTWEEALSYTPEVIFHLAAETGTGQSMDEITRYCDTNIIGTSIMLELVNTGNYGVKKIILSSSRAVYGEGENCVSNLNLCPVSVYGVTKLTQEQLVRTASKVPYTILRYQNVIGDGQSLHNPYTGIICIFSTLLEKNKEVTVFDSGEPTRDFIYVDDVVDATLVCANSSNTNYETYDVGTGTASSILSIAHKLKTLLNSNSDILVTDYHRSGDIIHAKASTKKITDEVGWKSKYSLDYALERFVKWLKERK